jgi:hypothetical protein
MARIDYGNDLSADILQPGYTTTSDGFGLITISATFKSDATSGAFAPFVRGTPFPVASYNYCASHKGSISWDALGVATLKVDYVGIDPSVNGGTMTNPNTSAANGLTADNITAHPNFFVAQGAPYLGAIAGEAPFTQDAPNNFAPVVNGAPAYLGLNGSCFEKPNGGRFIGFVDPAYPQYYGKTQYLAPTTSYSGIMYVEEEASVIVLLDLLGTSSSTNSWSTFPLLPTWAPVGTGFAGNPVNLLSQVNVESFGLIYKINYEIRYSRVGWELDVYKSF